MSEVSYTRVIPKLSWETWHRPLTPRSGISCGLSLSLCFFLSLLCLSVSLLLCVSVYLFLPVSLFLSLLCVCLSLCLPLCVSLSVSVCLFLPVSLSLSLSVSLCLCVCVLLGIWGKGVLVWRKISSSWRFFSSLFLESLLPHLPSFPGSHTCLVALSCCLLPIIIFFFIFFYFLGDFLTPAFRSFYSVALLMCLLLFITFLKVLSYSLIFSVFSDLSLFHGFLFSLRP